MTTVEATVVMSFRLFGLGLRRYGLGNTFLRKVFPAPLRRALYIRVLQVIIRGQSADDLHISPAKSFHEFALRTSSDVFYASFCFDFYLEVKFKTYLVKLAQITRAHHLRGRFLPVLMFLLPTATANLTLQCVIAFGTPTFPFLFWFGVSYEPDVCGTFQRCDEVDMQFLVQKLQIIPRSVP